MKRKDTSRLESPNNEAIGASASVITDDSRYERKQNRAVIDTLVGEVSDLVIQLEI